MLVVSRCVDKFLLQEESESASELYNMSTLYCRHLFIGCYIGMHASGVRVMMMMNPCWEGGEGGVLG